MKESKAILIKEFRKQSANQERRFGVFSCLCCKTEFEGRMDRFYIMTGLCRKCSNKEGGNKRKTHGHNNSNSRLHVTWSNMKRRCLNPTKKEIRNYSNITICDDWLLFESFMDWANSNGYNDNLTIDRIDSTKGYNPSNCRFVGYNTQSANRKKTNKNKSGYIGVWEDKNGRFRAKVVWKKKNII